MVGLGAGGSRTSQLLNKCSKLARCQLKLTRATDDQANVKVLIFLKLILL